MIGVNILSLVKISILSVGFGDCIHITLENGAQILVDTGYQYNYTDIMDKLNNSHKHIDFVILTHFHLDHISGAVKVVEAINVGGLLKKTNKVKAIIWWNKYCLSKSPTNIRFYKKLQSKLKGGLVKLYSVLSKDLTTIFGNEMIVLHPSRHSRYESDVNRNSIVLAIKVGDHQILLMGDATIEEEKMIIAENKIDLKKTCVLKIGHHGSLTSTSTDFISSINSENLKYLVCSCTDETGVEPPVDTHLTSIKTKTPHSRLIRTGDNGIKHDYTLTIRSIGGSVNVECAEGVI
jgi:competence protein ComEC